MIQYSKDSKDTLIAFGDIVYCRDATSIGRKSTNDSFCEPYLVLSEVHKMLSIWIFLIQVN